MSHRLVIIHWLDSRQPSAAWRFISDIEKGEPVECVSVGWLLEDTDSVKVICQNVGDIRSNGGAQASGVMTIPARCIVSIEDLAEATCPAPSSRPGSARKRPASSRQKR